jgi:hypothetical protein
VADGGPGLGTRSTVVHVATAAEAALLRRIGLFEFESDELMLKAVTQAAGSENPYMVFQSLLIAAQWAKGKAWRRAEVFGIVRGCLGSDRPLIRLAAANVAYQVLEEKDVVKGLLAHDTMFLLARPDFEPLCIIPLTKHAAQANASRLLAAAALASCRRRVIDAIGELQVRSAIPVLQAIDEDHDEWHTPTKDAAIAVLRRLNLNKSPY